MFRPGGRKGGCGRRRTNRFKGGGAEGEILMQCEKVRRGREMGQVVVGRAIILGDGMGEQGGRASQSMQGVVSGVIERWALAQVPGGAENEVAVNLIVQHIKWKLSHRAQVS